MNPQDILNQRLRRLSEHVRIREYIVCPTCFAPIVLTDGELETLPADVLCPTCGHRAWFEKESVRVYTPDA